jgi:hypothetical protein
VAGLNELLYANYHLPVNIGNLNEMTVLSSKNNRITAPRARLFLTVAGRRSSGALQPDISKASELFGWPKVNLELGLKKTIEFSLKVDAAMMKITSPRCVYRFAYCRRFLARSRGARFRRLLHRSKSTNSGDGSQSISPTQKSSS